MKAPVLLLALARFTFSVPTVSLADSTRPHVEDEDEIHLQWALCDVHPSIVLSKLGYLGKPPKRITPITYYDTNPPTHTARGIGTRTKTSHGSALSTVKVRFDLDQFNETELEVPDGVGCVYDRYGSSKLYTCEQRSPFPEDEDEEPVILWSPEQRALVEKFHDDMEWEDLVPYGPFEDSKWKLHLPINFRFFEKDRIKAVFDDVVAPLANKDKSDEAVALHLMEIEIKSPLAHGQEVYKVVSEYLRYRGVSFCSSQEGKTLRLFRAMGFEVEKSSIDSRRGNAGYTLQKPLVSGRQ